MVMARLKEQFPPEIGISPIYYPQHDINGDFFLIYITVLDPMLQKMWQPNLSGNGNNNTMRRAKIPTPGSGIANYWDLPYLRELT